MKRAYMILMPIVFGVLLIIAIVEAAKSSRGH